MTLQVTNTRTGEREPFEAPDDSAVTVYFCGLTVSADAHLGHARSWVHADVMRRWLEALDYEVTYVENFTDVNEKIVARTEDDELGDDEDAVARQFIESISSDMRELGLERADAYPRVSTHVPEIIELVETLIDSGYAYEANGSVYFDVSEFDSYGALSNQPTDALEAQGNPDEQPEKRDPSDFAVWKAGEAHPDDGPAGGQTWDSPWGEGRPGWHIECSAMSMAHLGESIDIHVGGQDLVFPHHENEVAQSEAATGERFARYWLHVRLLETDGEKMSSSLQNFFTVSDAVEAFGPSTIRMFLLSTSYSSPQTYSESALEEASQRWERLERAYDRAVEATTSADAQTRPADETFRSAVQQARDEFVAGMNDDFNTRAALRSLLELTSAVHSHLDDSVPFDYPALNDAIETFEEFGSDVLGLEFGNRQRSSEDGRLEDVVDIVLDLREAERAAGNYERADELRDALEATGLEVQDTDAGPDVRR